MSELVETFDDRSDDFSGVSSSAVGGDGFCLSFLRKRPAVVIFGLPKGEATPFVDVGDCGGHVGPDFNGGRPLVSIGGGGSGVS